MNNKPLVKNPPVSVSKFSTRASRKQQEEAYAKMTTEEQMEYDLEQLNYEEEQIKTHSVNKGYDKKKFNGWIKYLNQYNPTIKFIKNAKYAGKNIFSIRINENPYSINNKKFTVDSIREISNRFTKRLKEKNVNGGLMVAMDYGTLSWKSGKYRDIGDCVHLYNPNESYNLENVYEEPESIKSFVIYLILKDKGLNAGGDSEHNDCLYDALKEYLPNIDDVFGTAQNFKIQHLKLHRDDKVPLYKIDVVEKKLENYKINVRGDYIRTSTIKSEKTINLTLYNGHYKEDTEALKKKSFIPFSRFKEKKPLLYNPKTFEVCDGEKIWKIPKKEFYDMKRDFHNEYIFIETMRMRKEEELKTNMYEQYEKFVRVATELRDKSKGLINMFKTGSFRDTALILFDKFVKFLNPENLEQDESEWIDKALFSALISCEKYKGMLYKYDVKSMYPAMMTSTLKFPIKRGEFKIIKDFGEKYIEFGIYRCEIKPSSDENINKLFKINHDNYYTSIDVTNAKKLGLEINLIQDEKPNCLFYSREKTITFSEAFKNYVKVLFPLKNEGIEYSKHILNILWGALTQKNKIHDYVGEESNIDRDEEIIELYPCSSDETQTIIKTIKHRNFYKTPYARIGPFLTSQGRKMMSDLMYDEREYIKRVCTDGFLTTRKIHENVNVEIGCLKYEGYNEDGEIRNCTNKVDTKY